MIYLWLSLDKWTDSGHDNSKDGSLQHSDFYL